MESEISPNVRGTFQTLRTMWSEKVQDEQNSVKNKSVITRPHSQQCQKKINSNDMPTSTIMEERINDEPPKVILNVNNSFGFDSLEKSSTINDTDDSLPLPAPPTTAIFQNQVQSVITLQQSVMKMFDVDKNKLNAFDAKTSGIRHWHLARHVFRSGLIFISSRRASDSIIPLLMKTQMAQCRRRTESLDSVQTETPFETLIDYISFNDDENMKTSHKKIIIKRAISDTTACIQRNKLQDTIAQYETLMRHLKNYDKFMETYPMQISLSSDKKSSNTKEIIKNKKEYLIDKSSRRSSQTQSLARNAGRTFTEFIMNDLLLTDVHKPAQILQASPKTIHTASQTESNDLITTIETISTDETNQVIEELNNVLTTNENDEVQITPNSEINVIILNSAPAPDSTIIAPKERPLIQRLFEGNKTAYTPEDNDMKSDRIPEELMVTYETAKKRCFIPSETLLYAAKMIKIDRRGYKERLRIFCITNERIYIITKKNPYPKEHVLFKDILGIYCTPYKDGFICLKTREMRDDRGDWLFFVDHPCETVTQIFMAMGKSNNDDNYLKFEAKFNHTRRSTGTFSDEGIIEARLSTKFYIKYEQYEIFAIYTP